MKVCLGDICTISTGQSAPQDKSAFTANGIPFIRAGCLAALLEGKKEDEFELIDQEHAKKFRLKLFPKDTIIFAKSGMSAKLGRVYRLKSPCYLVSHLAAVIPSKKIDPGYLHRWLEKNPPSTLIANEAYPSIKTSVIKQVQIPLPPLAEQKRIAAILDKADAIRRKRQRAIKLADDFLRATFLDMFGDPVTNPKGWEVKEFEEIVADTKLGLVRSSKEFGWGFDTPYVRMDALTIDGKFLPEKVQNTYANKIEIESYSLRPGDFLFNTRNSKELVGKVCVFPGPEGCLFNNNLMRIRFCKGIEPTFIAAQFQFQHIKRELEKIKSGTTSVFAIYWKSLRSLPVLVPSTNVQQRYASIVNSVERYLMRAINYGHETTNFFNSLTQRAFRGEL